MTERAVGEDPVKILAISAGLGTPSATRMLVDKLAAAVRGQLPAVAAAQPVEIVEVREIATDLLSAQLGHLMPAGLRQLQQRIHRADALIAVAPVHNGQPAALFSLLFEVLDEATLRDKPVLLGATGGTARHSLVIDRAMLPMLHYLHALVAPISIFAATDDWAGDSLDRRAQQAAASLLRLVPGTITTARGSASPPPQEPRVTEGNDFESMLRRVAQGRRAAGG
ncbi:CE1759 family FMN reductase [Propionibacterium cyclohexanicum]|uniref:CE1759 family FMN reductase n=1 Tax=Propionibacterium cyclohexanicum TaxID=64702 RepID=UPI000A4C8737|nr:CE1759 family FMN reductase [Propionibacterium cyclohexanicum]